MKSFHETISRSAVGKTAINNYFLLQVTIPRLLDTVILIDFKPTGSDLIRFDLIIG